MKNYDFYSKFSTKDVNVLSELDSFLKTPLTYYNKDTVDLFLIALGNAYNCRTIIYECTRTHLWKIDLSKDSGNYEKTLYFAKTDLNHLDVVIPAEPMETGNDSDDTDVVPEQIETETDDDVIITKVVESSLFEVEFLGRKSMKIESDESQCKDNSNSDSEISLEKIRTDVLSSFIKNKKRRLESPVRHTSSGKIYVEEMYWQDTSINQTNQLPFDIDGNCIFEVPINERWKTLGTIKRKQKKWF